MNRAARRLIRFMQRRDRTAHPVGKCVMLNKILLGCGAVSSLLYVATDFLAALRYDGYSYKDQWVSELIATGSPVRPLMVALLTPYNLLAAAFGVGVWLVADGKRATRLTGAMLIASAAAGELTMLFFAMDRRGAEETARGALHGPMTMVMSIFTVLAMAFGSRIRGWGFRRYTYATILVLLVFGVATSLYIPRLAANESTPWMGAIERVNIYAQMLWVAVLSGSLLRTVASGTPRQVGRSTAIPRMLPR